MTGSTVRSDPTRQRAGLLLALVAPMLPSDRMVALSDMPADALDGCAALLVEINLAVATARARRARVDAERST